MLEPAQFLPGSFEVLSVQASWIKSLSRSNYLFGVEEGSTYLNIKFYRPRYFRWGGRKCGFLELDCKQDKRRGLADEIMG